MNISHILPKEIKPKNDTQQEHVWHLNTQPEGVPEVKKEGLKGGTSILTLTGVTLGDCPSEVTLQSVVKILPPPIHNKTQTNANRV